MDAQSKQGTSTGHLPAIRAGKGKGSRQNATPRKPLDTMVLPVSKIAHTPGALSNTGETPAAILAILVALQDFQQVMKHCPQSWVTSNNGKIYMCIEPVGGRLVLVNGVPHLDGVPVFVILANLEAPKTAEK